MAQFDSLTWGSTPESEPLPKDAALMCSTPIATPPEPNPPYSYAA